MKNKLDKKSLIIILILAVLVVGFGAFATTVYTKAEKKTFEKPDPYNISKMMKEVKKYTRRSEEAKTNINSILEKFFPMGSSQESILENLRSYGFKITNLDELESYKSENKEKYDANYGAYKSIKISGFLFKHHLSIRLHFKKSKLSKVTGTTSMSHF